MLILFHNEINLDAAKNVILAGVKSVVLHDKKSVETWDLGANFYFSESDIGKNRALVCANKLQELNTTVLVTADTSEITEALISDFQVVISVLFQL